MLDSKDAKNSPCYWGLVETGRHNNGGINGALDKHLILEEIDQILYKHLQKWTMQYFQQIESPSSWLNVRRHPTPV
ncbi:hypothetical protein [Marinobacter sp. KMM 10035]|uniref:hypothetical protein n=1 Tax=Marinobacter sp. KMM 10035 TaxID=3134034 RepID=UPI00397E4146